MAARRSTFGSVRRLASGRWQARVRGTGGALVAAPHTFESRRLAEEWVAQQRADRSRGLEVAIDAGRRLFADYADEWLGSRHGLAPRTFEMYDGQLRLHIVPTFGAVRLDAIKPPEVRTWYKAIAVKVSPLVAAKCYRLLSSILRTAVTDELILRNPCVIAGAGVERHAERVPPTLAQVDALADVIRPQWRALVVLGAWSGLRWGELTALTRDRIDFVHGRVHVSCSLVQTSRGWHIGPPKSAAGIRTVHLPKHVMAELEQHLARFVGPTGDAFLFSGPRGGMLIRSKFSRPWIAACREVGCVGLRFHDLRHLASTMAATTGATTKELMARMGHASPRAALIYQHATSDRDEAIARALDEIQQRRGQGS